MDRGASKSFEVLRAILGYRRVTGIFGCDFRGKRIYGGRGAAPWARIGKREDGGWRMGGNVDRKRKPGGRSKLQAGSEDGCGRNNRWLAGVRKREQAPALHTLRDSMAGRGVGQFNNAEMIRTRYSCRSYGPCDFFWGGSIHMALLWSLGIVRRSRQRFRIQEHVGFFVLFVSFVLRNPESGRASRRDATCLRTVTDGVVARSAS